LFKHPLFITEIEIHFYLPFSSRIIYIFGIQSVLSLPLAWKQ